MHSLWLLPSPTLFGKLEQQIEQFALEFQAPLFLPHLTLASKIKGEKTVLLDHCKKLASKVMPLETMVEGIGMEDEYFRCLYFRMNCDLAILQAQKTAIEFFDLKPTTTFNPHLSLLYGHFSEEQKRLAIQRNIIQFPFTISFDRLCLVNTQQEVENWNVLE